MSSAYRLIAVTRGAAGRERIYDFDTAVVRVGRDDAVEVRLPHVEVSPLHLTLERSAGVVFAVDAGSFCGTLLRGEPLVPGVPSALADGDVLQIGHHFELAYYAVSPREAMLTGPEITADLAQRLVEDLLASGVDGAIVDASTAPALVGRAGIVAGRRYPLPAPKGGLVFGRGAGCDVTLLDPDLSREHFEVRRTWGGVTVMDLGSKNGTLVDDRRLAPREPVALVDGALVRAGSCVLSLADPAARYLAQLDELASAAHGAAGAPARATGPRPAGEGASGAGDRRDGAGAGGDARDAGAGGAGGDAEGVSAGTDAGTDDEAEVRGAPAGAAEQHRREGAPAVAQGAQVAAPPARAAGYLPLIVIAVVVAAAVAALVLLLAS